jgi:putative holliday junction resolvase
MRILAIDPGMKRIGVAVSDESQTIARPLNRIERTAWKKVLLTVKDLVSEFDAAALVIGLPFNFDGTESEMSAEARELQRKFALSLDIPVFLQDERATSYEAKGRLWEKGADLAVTRKQVDSEAAAIILSDFLDRLNAGRSSSPSAAEK